MVEKKTMWPGAEDQQEVVVGTQEGSRHGYFIMNIIPYRIYTYILLNREK